MPPTGEEPQLKSNAYEVNQDFFVCLFLFFCFSFGVFVFYLCLHEDIRHIR